MNTKYLVEYEHWSEEWCGGTWDYESKSFDTLEEATEHTETIKSRYEYKGSEEDYPVRNMKVYRKTEIK